MGFDHLFLRVARRALDWLSGGDLASPGRQALAWSALVLALAAALASGLVGLALWLLVRGLELAAALLTDAGPALAVLVAAVWALRRLAAGRRRPAEAPVAQAGAQPVPPTTERIAAVAAEQDQARHDADREATPAAAPQPPQPPDDELPASEPAGAFEADKHGDRGPGVPDRPDSAADPAEREREPIGEAGAVPGRSRSEIRRARRQAEAERRRERADADASLAALMGELADATQPMPDGGARSG